VNEKDIERAWEWLYKQNLLDAEEPDRETTLAAEFAAVREAEHRFTSTSRNSQARIRELEAGLGDWKVMHDRRAKEVASLQDEAIRRALAAVANLHSPDAAVLRELDGDNKTHDRYWMGWTDALDGACRALKSQKKE